MQAALVRTRKAKAKADVKTFLHVGCGLKYKDGTTPAFNTDGWKEVRLDIAPAVKPDILSDIRNMPEVESASVDAVFSSHNIEHLYPHEVAKAFAEFRRVLKPDGFLIITCPDLQSVCELVAQDKLDDPAYESVAGPISPLDIIYGYREAISRGRFYMAHKTGFTKKTLVIGLRKAGFGNVASFRRTSPIFDVWACATIEKMPDEAIVAMAKQHFPV
jgi:SAM-dependent methyltransferase